MVETVILCGGLGTRLREETEFRPKPMVNIGPRPVLWHIMKLYSTYGFKDFVLALGYKGDMIRDYFCNYELLNNDITIKLGHPEQTRIYQAHDERDWSITMVDTGEKTLKGGRLKRVQKYVNDDYFFVTYGDGLADIDLKELVAFHKRHGRLATVTGVNSASRFGELSIRGDQVVQFSEKPERYLQLHQRWLFRLQPGHLRLSGRWPGLRSRDRGPGRGRRGRPAHGVQASGKMGLHGHCYATWTT